MWYSTVVRALRRRPLHFHATNDSTYSITRTNQCQCAVTVSCIRQRANLCSHSNVVCCPGLTRSSKCWLWYPLSKNNRQLVIVSSVSVDGRPDCVSSGYSTMIANSVYSYTGIHLQHLFTHKYINRYKLKTKYKIFTTKISSREQFRTFFRTLMVLNL